MRPRPGGPVVTVPSWCGAVVMVRRGGHGAARWSWCGTVVTVRCSSHGAARRLRLGAVFEVVGYLGPGVGALAGEFGDDLGAVRGDGAGQGGPFGGGDDVGP
jgi:hypothetical protein